METQNQIKRTISKPEAINQIKKLIDENPAMNKTQLADLVCERFNFFDPKGNKQTSGCVKALRKLEKSGHFVLPGTSREPKKWQPRRLEMSVPDPIGLPDEVSKISNLELVIVKTEDQMRIWNELMICEHYKSAGRLVGRQIRYLIKSEHGWLGGISFSSAALQLEDRDNWIGWDKENRLKNLQYIVNMSRFLIRNNVNCQNLASHVLGLVVKQMPLDYEARYGLRPLLLESFVDTSLFKGTCYKAANWELVGQTKGRGRQDSKNEYKETIKDIYVFPLDIDFRTKMGGVTVKEVEPLSVNEVVDDDQWAQNEFGDAQLGDQRRAKRLVEIADNKMKSPGKSYNQAANGNKAQIKGYYRLIEKEDDLSEVNMPNILNPHKERTIRRMKSEEVVLCISDTTDLNYSHLDDCEGLGIIGSNQTKTVSNGLRLHSMLAVNQEGLPLGLIRTDCTAPQIKSKKDKRSRSEIPLEEKKIFCWIEDIRETMKIKDQLSETKIINVMDREGDCFELFDEHRTNCQDVELLVRASHNRKTMDNEKLFDAVKNTPVQGKAKIEISRQSQQKKKGKQKARNKREAREAEVSIRFTKVEIKAPYPYENKDPLEIYVVNVCEENPSKEVEGIDWYLLTTMTIKTIEDAEECVKYYRLRWRIEDWHRVVKSGCKVEELGNQTAERLKRVIAINLVIAWKIMLMTLLGREAPELPGEILFSEIEIEVLKAFAEKENIKKNPKTLGDLVFLVAKLGGYMGRAHDPPPGHQIMWRGYRKLKLLCEGYLLRGG